MNNRTGFQKSQAWMSGMVRNKYTMPRQYTRLFSVLAIQCLRECKGENWRSHFDNRRKGKNKVWKQQAKAKSQELNIFRNESENQEQKQKEKKRLQIFCLEQEDSMEGSQMSGGESTPQGSPSTTGWWKPTDSRFSLLFLGQIILRNTLRSSQRFRWNSAATADSGNLIQFSSVTELYQLFVTAWTAIHQASLSITHSQSLLKLMSIELMMPSNHLVLYSALLLLPSIFARIRVFSSFSSHTPLHWFSIPMPCSPPFHSTVSQVR